MRLKKLLTMNSTERKKYDVVIAGGGMIGIAMALSLSSFDLKIAVVEKIKRTNREQPSFDDRSTALSRSSQNMFEAMGIWEKIKEASTPINKIHVSEKGQFGFSHICSKEQQVEALGYVVINRVLGEVMLSELENKENIKMFCPYEIDSFSEQQTDCNISLKPNDKKKSKIELTSQLLIAASGADSGLHKLLGINSNVVNYHQDAIIGNVMTAIPIENRAFERFYSEGSIAFLPLANNRSAFIWILPNHKSEIMMNVSNNEFLEMLQKEFGLRLGKMSDLGNRVKYSLYLTRALRLHTKRSVLVGNAANGLHPIAAQGFNLGLRDVATLSDCIYEEIINEEFETNIGKILNKYSAWRNPDHKKLTYFTDGLVRLFDSKSRSMSILRRAGMVGFDLIPGFRKLFVKHTMGLAGKLPRLSRGIPYK